MTASPKFHHVSVLLDAVVDALQPRSGGRYLDGTLGGAGHAVAVLEASSPDGQLVGIDRDPTARAAAADRLAPFGDRATIVAGTYADMADLAGKQGPFDGILLDIGVSSPQLDDASRGFSFQADGPLDMRMDPTSGESAAEFLEHITESDLAHLLRTIGEEPRARRIARAIVAGRPWSGTVALADTIERASGYRNSRTHPATRSFQAIRVAVNGELDQLRRGLDAAVGLLAPGGRLAVISFHSLEDRIVKQYFRTLAGVGTPRDAYGHPITPPRLKIVTRKPIRGATADSGNPRARSASLRVASCLP